MGLRLNTSRTAFCGAFLVPHKVPQPRPNQGAFQKKTQKRLEKPGAWFSGSFVARRSRSSGSDLDLGCWWLFLLRLPGGFGLRGKS